MKTKKGKILIIITVVSFIALMLAACDYDTSQDESTAPGPEKSTEEKEYEYGDDASNYENDENDSDDDIDTNYYKPDACDSAENHRDFIHLSKYDRVCSASA